MFVRVQDLDVHVQLGGDPASPPLLMLHSLGTNTHVWDFQTEVLAARYRVIRPDLRGHGLTTVTPGPYTLEQMARDVIALLDALNVAKAHVVGLSIGGMIAQVLAHQAPDRVGGLILCDTAMAVPPADAWLGRAAAVRAGGMTAVADGVMSRWVTPSFLGTPTAMGLRAMLLRCDPEGYAGGCEALAAADLAAQTATLRLPALVVVGDQDQATPMTSAQALAAAIPGAALTVIADAAHIAPMQQPDAITEAIGKFLAAQA
jgi:3-oxoadipate enol-lactonase